MHIRFLYLNKKSETLINEVLIEHKFEKLKIGIDNISVIYRLGYAKLCIHCHSVIFKFIFIFYKLMDSHFETLERKYIF